MLKGLRVPTHRIDAPGVLILAHDDAWDHDRLEAEQVECVAAALCAVQSDARDAFAAQRGVRVDELTAEQIVDADASCKLTEADEDAARAGHPWRRYQSGLTRYQPDAPDQGPRGPTCASGYLLPDAVAARYELRRIPWRERARIEVDGDLFSRFERYVRAGLAGVDAGELQWRAERPTDRVPEDVLEVICEASGGPAVNLIALAAACKNFSEGLGEAEGKR